jgi:hypothetical protein
MKVDPALEDPTVIPSLPNVLLIGDSISIGYTLPVRELLQGKASIFRPPINCQSTIRGLRLLDEWLGDGEWSVIHFNFGLHDLKYIDESGQMIKPHEGTQQVPIETYESNLNEIVRRLQKTKAELIWCSTTPIPKLGSHGRIPGDDERFNQAALRVADAHNLVTNDLHSFALGRDESIQQKTNNVHFSDQGYAILGTQVAKVIETVLDQCENARD